MKFFECQVCGQPFFFENSLCESCDRRVGFLSSKMTMTALEPRGERWKALADPNSRLCLLRQLGFRRLQLACSS